MVRCLYNDIENCECDWSGEECELIYHMTNNHEFLKYSTSLHNKILLELVLDLQKSGYTYKLTLKGKSSLISYTGQMTGIELKDPKQYQNCLQVHQVQMEKFSYLEGSEAMYKVLVSIE